jgi:glycerophosphoryl diester phosphodiesterase
MDKQLKILNIGHRGAMFHAPENTRVSFQAAKNAGADWIEFDVRLTKDKILVVLHDRKVNRTSTGKGRVRALNYDRLKNMDFGSWFHTRFLGESVMTLEEVFREFPDLGFNIELKDLRSTKPLADFLNACPKKRLENILVSSFRPAILKKFQKYCKFVPTGLLLLRRFGLKRKLNIAKKLSLYSIHLEEKLLTPEIVSEVKNRGFEIIVWCHTFCHDGRLSQMVEYPVRGIITDSPELLGRHIGRKGERA